MLHYKVKDRTYTFSYKELKEKYDEFIQLDNETFINRAAEAAHLACYICFIKEVSLEAALGNKGVVHELCHLLHFKGDADFSIEDIRQTFKMVCELA